MVPMHPFPDSFKRMIADVVPAMPMDIINLIGAYATSVDYAALAKVRLMFDKAGGVTNPDVRNAIKEAFISSECPSQSKSALMQTFCRSIWIDMSRDDMFWQAEAVRIFNEIADTGYQLMFDGINLSGLTLADYNWKGVRMRHADLSNAVLAGLHMEGADLTGTNVVHGQWVNLNLDNANMTDVDLSQLTDKRRVTLEGAIGLNDVDAPVAYDAQ